MTITSEDPGNPAVINEMFINNAKNIQISGVKFDYNGTMAADTGAWLKNKPFTFQKTTNVTLDDVAFEGNRANEFGTGLGLYVKESKGFALTNSDMSNFHTAIKVWNSADTTIKGNTLREMNFDGMQLSGLDGAVIEDNYLGQYRAQNPGAAHMDNIQLYSGGDSGASQNVTIRGNTMDSPDARHGVFIFNELYAAGDQTAVHKNILVEDNYIRSTNMHGITVIQADGVAVRNNVLVQNPDLGSTDRPMINVSLTSKNVEIIGNTAHSVQDAQDATWSVYGNAVATRSRVHFDGVYVDGVLQPSIRPSGQSQPSKADVFDINPVYSGKTSFLASGVNFAEGDKLVFKGFEAGTFATSSLDKTVTILNGGRGVEINSFGDLDKVLTHSSGVTFAADANGGDLFALSIDQQVNDVTVLLQNFVGFGDTLL